MTDTLLYDKEVDLIRSEKLLHLIAVVIVLCLRHPGDSSYTPSSEAWRMRHEEIKQRGVTASRTTRCPRDK